MSKGAYTDLEAIEDAEFEEAEEQLRDSGFGHIEEKDEGWWFEMAHLLREYYAEHLHYPTEKEFRELWRQDVQEQVRKIRKILGVTPH